MAASWDPEVIERGQAVAARESRAVGIHWTFAPMVDIARDPRWGRIVEGAGEDPYLGAAVAVAQVRGFQGEDFGSPERIIAGPKHFAGYGAALGGRDYDEVNLSDYELWNVYFPPFQAARRGRGGQRDDGVHEPQRHPGLRQPRGCSPTCCGSSGASTGSWSATPTPSATSSRTGFAADLADAGARGVTAGVDLEMAMTDPAYSHLPEAVETRRGERGGDRRLRPAGPGGQAAARAVREPVRRRGPGPHRAGRPGAPRGGAGGGGAVGGAAAQRGRPAAAGRRAALGSVAVLGPLADSQRDTLGPWVLRLRPRAETVTVLDGSASAGSATPTEVRYAPGIRPAQRVFPSMFDMFPGNTPPDPEDFDDEAELQRAVELARDSDLAVVVLGEWQQMIGEAASRSSLELPGRQLELLQAVVETGTPVVLLVMNGRPLDLRWAVEHVPAILDIWYPGIQGGAAVANLLLGDVSPGGKLPFTWPRTVGQVPMIYAHTMSHEPENQARRYWDEESTPLFPFGYGLSYARFAYADLSVDRPRLPAGRERDGLGHRAQHRRPGRRRGGPAVPAPAPRHGRPAGSRAQGLPAGAPRGGGRADGDVHARFGELRYWNAGVRDFVIDPSTFDVWVGGDSTAELSTTFTTT